MKPRLLPILGVFAAALFQSLEVPAAETARVAIAESDFCRSLEYTGKMVQEPGWHIWGCSPIIGEDGKYLLYFKGKGANMGVAVAKQLDGPYVHQPAKLSANEVRVEDGYAFVQDGQVWLVTTDNRGKYTRGGGLLWTSRDGMTFDPNAQRGYFGPSHYLPTVERSQLRSYYGAGTFQRPQVLVQNGRPAYLYIASGTVINGGDGSVCYVFKCSPGGEAK
jgi:hypothetical protein